MWTEAQLTEDLRELGVSAGDSVLVHASLTALGAMENEGATLLAALRNALGAEGTLLVPTFTRRHLDPATRSDWEKPAEEIERLRETVPPYNPETPPDALLVGAFPELVWAHPDAMRSLHPTCSFAALGAQAEFLTQAAPFHYPLGSDSPLARLHQLNGQVLLIGTGQSANVSLHLAEVWANVAYIHRTATLKQRDGTWAKMQGSPECSAGFRKIEPLLRQGRILRSGYVGNAESQRMRQRPLVSMAVSMLQGDAKALLCDEVTCPTCIPARKLLGDAY